MTMNAHTFKPSGRDGTVCVARAAEDYDADICDKPAGHPIHTTIGRNPAVSGRWAGATDAERVKLLADAHGDALAEHWSRVDHQAHECMGYRCVVHGRTPAEARTGVSDRAAAVLADVAVLRRVLLKSLHPRLDRIEAYIRRDES